MPTWVAPSNSHEVLDGGAGAGAHADGLQPSKWIRRPRPMLDSRTRLVRNCMRPTGMADAAVGVCRLINAANAVALGTGPFSVRREEVRAGDEEDVVDEAEEEAVVAVEAKANQVRFSLLHWLSRGQWRQGVRCNNPLTLLQCPVAVTRETSCALSWPARTAVGAVGRSGAS